MPGEIATSVGSKINFSGAWEACGRWAQRSFEFCKEMSTKIGPENLRIGGTVVLGNSLFYLFTSALIGCGERRFATHELTRGSTTASQRNIKKHLLHEIIPFTLTVLFNFAISHLFKLQLSTTAIFGISIGALALRMLLNREATPATPVILTPPPGGDTVPPRDDANPPGPDAERSTDPVVPPTGDGNTTPRPDAVPPTGDGNPTPGPETERSTDPVVPPPVDANPPANTTTGQPLSRRERRRRNNGTANPNPSGSSPHVGAPPSRPPPRAPSVNSGAASTNPVEQTN